MTKLDARRLRAIEGQTITLSLLDGRRIDDAQLVSAGRGCAETLWIYANGDDLFIPLNNVRAAWQDGYEPAA